MAGKQSTGESMSRRETLQSVGAGLLGVGTVSKLGESSEIIDILKESLRLRKQNNWSVLRWQQYLKAQGADVVSKTIQVEPEPVPLKFDQYQSEFTFTYAYYSIVDYAMVDFNWHHGNGDLDDYGSAPPDNARISFGDDYYRDYYYDNWVYYGDNSGDPPVRSKYKDHGAVAEFRDGDDNDGEGYFGVRIDPEQGTSEYNRDLYFRYVHTWEEIELSTSLSTQPPFLLMNLSGSDKKWDVERSYTEADIDGQGETYSPSK